MDRTQSDSKLVVKLGFLSSILIINFLHHCGCVCTMSAYDNVRVAGAKGENTVWGWGR